MPTRSASPAGTSLRKGISSSTAARPRATDRGLPRQRARQRQLAASQQRFLGNQIAQLPLPAQARAVRAAPAHVIEVRVAAVEAPQGLQRRPVHVAQVCPRAILETRPGEIRVAVATHRLVQPVEPGGNALHDVVMRAFSLRAAGSQGPGPARGRGGGEAGCRHAPATGLPGSRPPDGRGAESPARAAAAAGVFPERPGFLPGQGCHTDAAGPSNPAHHPLPRYWSLAARAHDGWVDASADSSARSIAVDRSRHCCVPP